VERGCAADARSQTAAHRAGASATRDGAVTGVFGLLQGGMGMSKHDEWLRTVLSELMQVDASQISSTQSFADQGMDSLVGLRLTRKLEDLLGVEVELEWLFDNPTIQDLSRFLDERFGALDALPVRPDQDCRINA
jgi:acyl carrier protein